MANIELVHIEKSYETGIKVIKDVNIEVKDKEFLVLVGPSGCGKSTLLRMIAGLEDISSGDLVLDGTKINDLEPKDRDIAMVFQNYALYPHMTVFENMAFGLKLRKFSKQDINERVNNAAKILEIESLLDRKPKDMSGGQRQRVAIGRAIVRNPKLFLFDEPLSNLDAKLRVQMRMELQKLHKDLQATIIYVTHDQTEAMTLGDRIVVLKEGIIQQIDTPIKLYNYPTNIFVAGFIGTPPMNLIEGKIIHNNETWFETEDPTFRLSLNAISNGQDLKVYSGKKLSLGIRAENITISETDICDFSAKIESFENMGNEILAYFTLAGNKFIARLAVMHNIEIGQEVNFNFDTDKLHFFGEDGVRLGLE